MPTKKRSKARKPRRMSDADALALNEAMSLVSARKSQTDFQYFVLDTLRTKGMSITELSDRVGRDYPDVHRTLTHAGARIDLRLVGSIFYALGLDVEVRIDGKDVARHVKTYEEE